MIGAHASELPMAAELIIHGEVDDGFGAVADAFVSNFESRDELGAGFCLYVDVRRCVEPWAGVADRRTGEPWTADTPSCRRPASLPGSGSTTRRLR